jgi:predicted aconitase with swiveling domain
VGRLEFKGRPIVPGDARGEAVVLESISFYGDVDPKTGLLVDGRSIKGKILVARRSRGSTVGSYVIYALKKYGNSPAAIILGRSEPIVIAGAVLAQTPLYDSLPDSFFRHIRDGVEIEVRRDGLVVVSI